MLQDFEMELTTSGGQVMTTTSAASYGSYPLDFNPGALGGDPAVGDPLQGFVRVIEAPIGAAGTNVTFDLVVATGVTGQNEVVVSTRAIPTATLATDTVHRLGSALPLVTSATARYINVKVTNGTAQTQGKYRVWVAKGTDLAPYNDGAKVQ